MRFTLYPSQRSVNCGNGAEHAPTGLSEGGSLRGACSALRRPGALQSGKLEARRRISPLRAAGPLLEKDLWSVREGSLERMYGDSPGIGSTRAKASPTAPLRQPGYAGRRRNGVDRDGSSEARAGLTSSNPVGRCGASRLYWKPKNRRHHERRSSTGTVSGALSEDR